MNPLTLVKRIQKINSQEASLGISEEASWHAKYKESAYVFVGGIPYDLTEGDLLAVFAQYGEIVDVNLVRDKGTGKSKGFAFVAYEDQRSTILAVDNLNGAQILGRVIRVDHVSNYKKKEEEDEAEEQKKREERGVCRAFQRGECTRGAGCKFSHDEQRAANTGWGAEDQKGKWGHDRFDGPERSEKKSGSRPQVRDAQRSDKDEKKSRRHADDDREPGSRGHLDRREDTKLRRLDERETSSPTSRGYEGREGSRQRRYNDEHRSREISDKREDKRSRRSDYDDFEPRPREGSDRREEKRPRHDNEPRSREGRDPREEKRSTKQEPESYSRGYEDRKVESRSAHGRDLSSQHR